MPAKATRGTRATAQESARFTSDRGIPVSRDDYISFFAIRRLVGANPIFL